MHEARVQQRAHDDGHPAHAIDVAHHVPAEGLDVGEQRDLGADAVEVIHRQIDVRLVSESEQVQHRVGRSAESHDDGDRILERLLGDDVSGGDALTNQFDHGLARAARESVAATINSRRCSGAGQ